VAGFGSIDPGDGRLDAVFVHPDMMGKGIGKGIEAFCEDLARSAGLSELKLGHNHGIRAVAAVLQWTFRQDQFDRVHAFVRVDNRRSERLLQRSGFVREGCLRNHRVCRGQPHDFYIYGLLRSDWAAVSPDFFAAFHRT
jgi:GNAT superfamily N-acetyltransferase